jgi:hypothetical protein
VKAPSGTAQQHHLIRAVDRWWLFYFDASSPMELQARSSADFVTWSAPVPIALGFAEHIAFGSNLDVAYRHVGADDVLHISVTAIAPNVISHRLHKRARALVSGSTLTVTDPFTTVTEDVVPTFAAYADSPSVTISPTTGYVVDTSGATNFISAQEFVWWSSAPESGGPSGPSFGSTMLAGADPSLAVFNRASWFVDPQVILLYTFGDGASGQAQRFVWNRGDPPPFGSFKGSSDLFNPVSFPQNDWSSCVDADGVSHAIRRLSTGDFEHKIYQAGNWSNAAAPPNEIGEPNTGIVLVPRVSPAHEVWLFTIRNDAARTIRVSQFASGQWSAWADFLATPAPRSNLAAWAPQLDGADPNAGSSPALLWTEGSPPTWSIVGMLVDGP